MPGGENSIARKPVQRFKRLAGSLETLISSIAQDWEAAADAPAGGDGLTLTEGDGPTKPIHGKLRKAQLLFTELHSVTRKAHGAMENIRNKVATAKQSMDSNHLQLENLLYERNHLAGETQLCKDFTMSELSKMEEAEEQGFLEDVDTLQTPEEHAENLAILNDQKDQRTSAQLELKAAQIRVKAASSALNESRDYLDKLPEHVKEVEKALAPLKKSMPWRPGSRRGRHENAAELPGPLFTLYCQLEAYCDSVLAEAGAEDESGAASSSVAHGRGRGGGGGDHKPAAAASVTLVPAKIYVSPSAKAAAQGPTDASDSAQVPGAAVKTTSAAPPKPSHEPDGKRQRRHYDQHNAGSGVSVLEREEKRNISRREAGKCTLEALKPSQMEVLLTLNLDDDAASDGKGAGSTAGKALSVHFSYLPALGVVAAYPQPGAPPGILANLFPNDTGHNTPNPVNHHGKAARASPLGIFEYPADVPCRPYRWAQWLAGLHFPPPAAAPATVVGTDRAVTMPIEPSIRSAVAALRSRARTRLALNGQLKAFAAGKGPSPLPGAESDLPEVTGKVGLRSWKELSGSEKQQAAVSFQERDSSKSGSSVQGEGEEEEGEDGAEAVSAAGASTPWEQFGARYFTGALKTNKGQGKERTVHIQVEVPAEYPLRPSLVSLTEDKSDAEPAGEAALKEELSAVANEVNAHYDTLLTEDVSRWDHLLSHQLILVMECLATNGGAALGRLRRGRMRRKPVVFDRLERTFVHR
ncbi:unnamed protein product [Pylaiella littoralis]